MILLEFLTRTGCHLCDQARPIVVREVSRIGASMEEVDIDHQTDPRWVRDYGLRIPVLLTPADEVIAEGVIEARSLRRALEGYRRRNIS